MKLRSDNLKGENMSVVICNKQGKKVKSEQRKRFVIMVMAKIKIYIYI